MFQIGKFVKLKSIMKETGKYLYVKMNDEK